ncbi:glycosyltransferase family 4 protein [Acidianus sulfidivorans]|uniref:glycosyltransferase family 4 protein n=1 Tax=Acidianus sulfidivorans TaxID=312539 RepID=UPI001F0D0F64|nr:glycosyltransferase family 4 protein [Acidianus sulfidivorans]
MLTLYEGFALAVAEALASSLPVVTRDLPWSSRFVKGTIKVKFDDVNAFAEEVVNLLKNEESRRRIGREGREFVKTLNWDRAAKMEKRALVEIYYS